MVREALHTTTVGCNRGAGAGLTTSEHTSPAWNRPYIIIQYRSALCWMHVRHADASLTRNTQTVQNWSAKLRWLIVHRPHSCLHWSASLNIKVRKSIYIQVVSQHFRCFFATENCFSEGSLNMLEGGDRSWWNSTLTEHETGLHGRRIPNTARRSHGSLKIHRRITFTLNELDVCRQVIVDNKTWRPTI